MSIFLQIIPWCVLSGYVALIRDYRMVCETLTDGSLFRPNLGHSGRYRAFKLVGDCGESSALSGNNQKPLWFLLLLLIVVVLVVAANSSGGSIVIAGIKLVLPFTHTLLF